MTKLLSFALALAVSVPVYAQKMGSSNRNAPKIEQTIMAGDATMSLNYTSITWADGQMMQRLADKETGARARQMVNDSAPNAPLASFETNVDVMCGKLHLPAGEYKVFYTIDDDTNWHINFMAGDKTHEMKLPLSPVKNEYKRLVMPIYAEDGGCGLYIAFGTQSCMLSMKAHKKGD